MYFWGINVTFVMASRLVSGIGTGAGASYWADMARNVPEAEKTSVFAIMMLFRQLGVVVGPGFNLLFKIFLAGNNEVKFGPFTLNIDSIPGLFMAVVWGIMLIFSMFFYTDLAEFNVKEKPRRGRPSIIPPQVNVARDSILPNLPHHTDLPEEAGVAPSRHGSDEALNEHSRLVNKRESVILPLPPFKPTWRDYAYALFKEDVLCLQFVLFVSGFVQTGLEALLPPMSYSYLEWSENATSLWFLFSGIATIGLFLLVSGPLTRFFHDYLLTIFGVLLNLAAFPFLIAMAYVCTQCCDHDFGRLQPNDPLAMPLLLLGFSLNICGLPFIAACTVSLFSNAVEEQYQGIAHGIRRSLSFVGFLIGPIWAGAYIPYLGINFIALLGMYTLALLMLFASKGTLFR